jgi:putative hemolysin
MPGGPFHLNASATTPAGRAAMIAARPLLSWLLGLRTYRSLYTLTQSKQDEPFACRALKALEIEPCVSDEDRVHVPPNGPLIVASNHPHGALDGLVLASILQRHRADVRILTNHLLARIPELAEFCFFVDPFGGPSANARSRTGLRAALSWLSNGGTLIVFPAGEVAYRAGTSGSRVDSPWHTTVGRLGLTTGAQVVPAFVKGTNSRLFYAVGYVHPSFRTALLARELLKKRCQSVTVRLGPPLLPCDLAVAAGDDATTELIRQAVDQLANTVHLTASAPTTVAKLRRGLGRLALRAEGDKASAVCGSASNGSEIARLTTTSCLVDAGGFQVFLAEARQIPHTLQEIGRLREVTYRAVGEGTGGQLDLDAFDDRYLHLFSWDRQQKRVVGAYRIGPTDRIIATHGIDGLYTRTLFRYDERLIARLSPALELGRSFVRAEYQRNYNALLLLWKGIGQFVAHHPQYRVLFGPVSISRQYSQSSLHLLMAFLQQNHLDRDLADLVEAIHPRAVNPGLGNAMPQSIEETNTLLPEAEGNGKGIPILLRQYLKLNAKVLGFNVDPNFSDVLDALMMVDLTTVDVAILNRYLGRQEAAQFLAHHRAKQHAAAA